MSLNPSKRQQVSIFVIRFESNNKRIRRILDLSIKLCEAQKWEDIEYKIIAYAKRIDAHITGTLRINSLEDLRNVKDLWL